MTDTTGAAALRESAESMMNLLENLAGYEPQDIDMDAVELRFEDENGFDTGCDISIVDTAQQAADVIRALLDQLEAERQRTDEYEKGFWGKACARETQRANKAEAELAALKGDQVPVYQIEDADGWQDCEKDEYYSLIKSQSIPDVYCRVLFTAPQKPVVLLNSSTVMSRNYVVKQIESAGGIVKDGE